MRKEVHRQIILTVQCVLQQRWGLKPQSLGKEGLPPRTIRESFLEVVTLGLEYRFF